VIDSDYRGEIQVLLTQELLGGVVRLAPGDRIAQLVVVPCLLDSAEVDELDTTARGANGFGSSGRGAE
jgi:dUTP pyrophosphatase